jgi:hypothetical protein
MFDKNQDETMVYETLKVLKLALFNSECERKSGSKGNNIK